MQDLPYSTTRILYHNRLSNIHDLESYYTFLKLAWVDHSTLMIIMLGFGAIMGICSGMYLYTYLAKKQYIKVVD